MLHAVIMAGGAGTRFWPESRARRPKQLLKLVGERSMLQATVDRLAGLVNANETLVVTGAALVDEVRAQLPDLPPAAILGEPCKRDTAPCIGLAALYVSRSDPDALMAVLPSDHVILDAAALRESIRYAATLVEESSERIVTFGIRPTYPAQSFGYIERGAALPASPGRPPAFRVNRFREKPAAEVARQYLAAGNFYWNAGIFVWRASTILQALRTHQPEMLEHLEAIVAALDTKRSSEVFAERFAAIRGVSIDYAVMEKAQDVAVIEAPFDWDDVGSWQAISRLAGPDAEGNTIQAQHVGLRTKGSLVRAADGHLVATLGLTDCIVVHTPDATLVANKHDEEAIRELVKLLEQQGLQAYL